jgi:hypothetical protein
MNHLKSLLLGAVLAASAATANAAVIYATSVDSYIQGSDTISGGIDPARLVTSNALGAPDGKFLSLGLGGQLIVSFGRVFTSPGELWEITFGNRSGYLEEVEVYLGLGGMFTFLGNVTNAVAANPFVFAGTFDQIKLIDVSPDVPDRDGFDVDAIGVSPIPLPAGGLLLLSALGGALLLRRRAAA